MTVIYREQDASLNALKGYRMAVIGYGNLGRPFALNLRDSGLDVIVGNIDDDYAVQAHRDGFDVVDIAEAAQKCSVKLLMLPDEVLPEVYLASISPSLRPGDTLLFASGYNIAFGFVEPPPFVDVVMVAPRTIGAGVRDSVLRGRGFLSFIAVGQDATGGAWDRLMALALALGTLQLGAVELTFEQEAELDLFMEQSFLPAFMHLMTTAADLLIHEGYPPVAVLPDLYASGELSFVLDLAAERGMREVLRLYSLTAQYGMLSRNERFQDTKLQRQMQLVLEDIRSGKFAQEWAAEYASGYPRLETLRRRWSAMPFWAAEEQALTFLRQAPPASI
jgi:ketol-acid reductoisomerase